ncbi:hypothetical protein FKR81_41905 [Lentzea tibetensis]|uniref:Lipoprotein n=1 Tax=Lentzea tibetensis TaxID=2591470 RepID=A0A563EF08_9PSEU|nr:hypothetical protein [Lentzea tibetensis]TWP43994.1 hypothetical protein FKR81_41905 [Lentzea tibetensis]
MKKLLLAFPLLLVMSACGTKSYTYEVFYTIEGSGQAEVTSKDPAGAASTETVDLPVKRRAFLANSLGPTWVEVKPKSGSGDLTCVLQVEKEAEVKKTGNPARCEYTITEATDN